MGEMGAKCANEQMLTKVVDQRHTHGCIYINMARVQQECSNLKKQQYRVNVRKFGTSTDGKNKSICTNNL